MYRSRFLLALIAWTGVSSCLVQAEINYSVEMRPPNVLAVTMSFDPKGPEVALRLPKWAPGGYEYSEPVALENLTSSSGTVTKADDHSWRISNIRAEHLTVSYTLPIEWVDNCYQINGPSTYLYVAGRKTERCTISVVTDLAFAQSLDPVPGKSNTFKAHDYDTLIDNPISLGDIWIDTYEILGRKHEIVLKGADRANLDRNYLIKTCRAITEMQVDFFRSMPYKKYVWHVKVFDALDGAGGVEHLNSTSVSVASGVGPGAVSLLSHEFFHLWNAKRIRSKPLGPFDYDTLPKTGALWWLEGVTEYYACKLLYDYRIWDRQAFYNNIASNWRRVITNPAHTEVSPDESSRRVSEAEGGRGNHEGYRVSYYNVGFLAGFCLDTEIRHRTDNKRSLDDVMLALYEKCKDNQPGFAEDEIRLQCIKAAGPGIAVFYDRIILGPGPMPVAEQLAKFGLSLAEVDQPYTDVGFAWSASKSEKGIKVGDVRFGSGLQTDDVITELNGASVSGATARDITLAMRTAVSGLKPGTPAKARIRRGNGAFEVEVTPRAGSRMVSRVVEAEDASEAAVLRREKWLSERKVDLSGIRLGEKNRS